MFTNSTFIFQNASRDKSCGYVQIISDNNKAIIISIISIICSKEKIVIKHSINVQTIEKRYYVHIVVNECSSETRVQ